MTPRNTSFLRATLTLLGGGALAQLVPLLLGPVLSRLYTPEQFGAYTAFAVVAANLAVVACLRYEHALPLERDQHDALVLLALCLRILLGFTMLSALLGAALMFADLLAFAMLLPLAVAALGMAQLFGLWSVRQERFTMLAGSRFVQYGGSAVSQVLLGFSNPSGFGLALGSVISAVAAAAMLVKLPSGGWRDLQAVSSAELGAVFRRHRDFPLFNAPHAFLGALQDTLAVAVLALLSGEWAVGLWGLSLRYLKAPASLIGSAVSQALYPRIVGAATLAGRDAVRRVMLTLGIIALALLALILFFGPELFARAFGENWREAGELARALSPYIAFHFVASPLSIVTMAWGRQAWALRVAMLGQVGFIAALVVGHQYGGLLGAAWALSVVMSLYFSWYFWKLATWPVTTHEGEHASQ